MLKEQLHKYKLKGNKTMSRSMPSIATNYYTTLSNGANSTQFLIQAGPTTIFTIYCNGSNEAIIYDANTPSGNNLALTSFPGSGSTGTIRQLDFPNGLPLTHGLVVAVPNNDGEIIITYA
jgi:hypothetical protein